MLAFKVLSSYLFELSSAVLLRLGNVEDLVHVGRWLRAVEQREGGGRDQHEEGQQTGKGQHGRAIKSHSGWLNSMEIK